MGQGADYSLAYHSNILRGVGYTANFVSVLASEVEYGDTRVSGWSLVGGNSPWIYFINGIQRWW